MTVPFSSPTESRVHERLHRLVSVGAGVFFEDACRLVNESSDLRSTTHLHGHLVREIESATRQTLVAIPDVRALLPPPPKNSCERSSHRDEVGVILRFLGLDNDARALAWFSFVGKKNKKAWNTAAHRDELRGPRRLHDGYRATWLEFVGVLDVVLDAAEKTYELTITALDKAKGRDTPSQADVVFAMDHIGSGTITERFFFIDLPLWWLDRLERDGHFDDPAGDPHWPAAAYLARCAANVPARVAAIIEKVAPTDSPFVHAEFFRAAIAMVPVDLESAVLVAIRETKWIAEQTKLDFLLPQLVRELALSLLAVGRMDVAMAMAGTALSVPEVSGDEWTSRAKMSSWDYAELVKNFAPALAERDPEMAAAFLCGLLERSWIRAGDRRAAIEDHEQNGWGDDALDSLIASLRDVSVKHADRSPEELRAVVVGLEASGENLPRRIALHVLSWSSTFCTDLVVERLTDQRLLDDHHVFHELAVLAQTRFGQLSDAARDHVIRAFRVHADRGALEHGDQDEAATFSVTRVRHRYLRQWFSIVETDLNGPLREEFRGIISEFGASPHPLFLAYVTSHVGYGAPPMTAEQFAAASDDVVREFLLRWQPETRTFPFGMSRFSLAREIQRCASENLLRFARTEMLDGLHPCYVAAVLQAAVDATQGAWPAALTTANALGLIEWVIERAAPRELTGGNGPGEDGALHEGWAGAHRAALALASNVVTSTDPTNEPILRRIWNVIRRLQHHPDPVTARGDQMAYTNCARGAVARSAIALGLRLRAGVNPTLTSEIGEALTEIANPKLEPILAVRLACAWEFHNVCIVSPDAGRIIAGLLFPREEGELDADRLAAWIAFLKGNSGHALTYSLLSDAYRLATEHVGNAELEHSERLGSHLVWLTVHGVLPLSDTGPLATFIRNADVKARQHAIEGVGRSLLREREEIDRATVHRLQGLWTWWRTRALGTGDARDLAAFGWWFAAAGLDAEWLLAELPASLLAAEGTLEREHGVANRLAALAPGHPHQVASILGHFIEGGDGWRIMRSQSGLRAALAAILASDDAPMARAIASRLVSRGHAGFRDLASQG